MLLFSFVGKFYRLIVKIKKCKTVQRRNLKKTDEKQQYRKITIIIFIHILEDNYLCIYLWFFFFFFSSPYLICMVQILIPDIRKWPHLLCIWKKGKDRNGISHTILPILSPYPLALDRRLMNWKSFPMEWMLFIVNTKSVSHCGHGSVVWMPITNFLSFLPQGDQEEYYLVHPEVMGVFSTSGCNQGSKHLQQFSQWEVGSCSCTQSKATPISGLFPQGCHIKIRGLVS